MNFQEMPLGVLVAMFAVSAGAVWVAGTRLARYADAIATQTGIGRAFLGMILLGGVTSLPELAVSVTATLDGNPVLSINDLLGSAAINVVILAIADAFMGRKALTSTAPSSTLMLQGILSVILLGMVAGAVISGDRTILGMGIWSWAMLAVYLGSVALLANTRSPREWKPSHPAPREQSGQTREGQWPMGKLAGLTCAVALVILAAGFVLAKSGSAIAEQTGLGASFFGAVFLAAATSLPEVSTVLSAVRLKQYEMAFSDAIGTNLFNITILVLVDLLHPGDPVLRQAGPFAAFGALLALLLTATFMVGMLERRDRTVLRMGIDSLVVIVTYCIGVGVLYGLR